MSSNITSLSIDLAKNVFQLHGTNKQGKPILKQRINRSKLSQTMANLPICNVYMEACGSSNYWGREFAKLGHKVQLINPKYVKPYVKRNKNDRNDAAAIAAASRDPDMRFCEVKTEAMQDIQSVHRMRDLTIKQRTALSNQIRGILAEYGIVSVQGLCKLRKKLPEILENENNQLSPILIDCLRTAYEQLKEFDEKISGYDQKIVNIFKQNPACHKLAEIPGIGKLGATMLFAMLGTGGGFKNGRHFAAFLGLTPKQHSSGNKERLLGISKCGDTYMRTLLVHGARSALHWSPGKSDKLNIWLQQLAKRKCHNKVAVALANKIARIAWAVIHYETKYDPNYKPKTFINNKKGGLARYGAVTKRASLARVQA